MNWYLDYRLVRNEEENIVEIYLNPNTPEFSDEFLSNIKRNILTFDKQIEKLVQQKFPDVKVNTVKLILGAAVVGTIPFAAGTTAKAAELTTTIAQQTSTSSTITVLDTTGVVTASKLNVRSGPSTDYSVIHVLWQGNKVKVIGQMGGWYKIRLSDGRTGWVSSSYLKLEDARQQKINTVIATAQSLLGTPYVWGGASPADGGFDCSGFTQYVYGKAGVTLNRISADQATQGVSVPRTDLQPGDLVFFSLNNDGRISHVGIYIGDGKMIHSPKTGDVVKTTDITTSFWQGAFVTARRVI